MKLIHTSPSEVFTSLKTQKNHQSIYCPTINGCISVGDFVCMGAALNVEVLAIDADINFVSAQMLKQFRVSITFGQVKKICESQGARLSNDEEEGIMLDMNLYLKRDQLDVSTAVFLVKACLFR
jgi:hypothetical protein